MFRYVSLTNREADTVARCTRMNSRFEGTGVVAIGRRTKLWNAVCAGALLGMTALPPAVAEETCTTVSQMQPAERDALTAAAAGLAGKIQSGDETGLKASTIAEYQGNFTGIASAVALATPKLKGAQLLVDQIYLLDASSLKAGDNGVNPDTSFSCRLNKSASEADFAIPQLPPGKYAFAMVRMEGPAPWRLSLLMRQEGGQWLLAGLYPKPLTAGGHDGLWYWKQARTLESQNEPWAAWLYLQEARALVLPANFVSSTHLDKLQAELTATAPPAVSAGLSMDAPLVVKGVDGQEYRFTNLSVEDAFGLDVAAHMKVETIEDVSAARKRNVDAAAALLAAHPELRKEFHGVWVFAEAPGKSPYATEVAMAEIK